MGSRAGEDAAIIRMLRGDREVMTRVVATLAGDDEAERRRWQGMLGGLLEALIARSIEAAAFDFPLENSFWSPFTRSQARDVAGALASLGYRHDGFGGWADDRVPSQRDLSLAVGYAGLDPMRIRRWPSEAEMPDLLRDVTRRRRRVRLGGGRRADARRARLAARAARRRPGRALERVGQRPAAAAVGGLSRR